jgi:aquaporin Z
MKKYLVEFIGTFFLVLTIGLAVRGGAVPAPLAIGAALMAMVFAGGHVSGAHYNPAVTLAVFLRGKCDKSDVVPYWIAQFVAAVLAGVVVSFLFNGRVAAPALHGTTPSVIVEFLFTFALVWVVLNVATAKGTSGNSFYGLAIGVTVIAGAFTVGGISGGAFNPAVGLGVVTMGLESVKQFAVYLVSDFAGAFAAALAYKAVNGSE